MNRRTAHFSFLVATLTCIASASAADVRRVEHERYATPHWVYDARFHHNRYYPAHGYVVEALPPGNIAIGFRGAQFWFHSGVWYQRVGPRYVVVRPPAGVIVPVLPPDYTVVYYGAVPYYYANDVYYVQQTTGYEVVAPPQAVPQAQAAPAAPPASAPGVWYYCDSAKGYYPGREPVSRRLEKRASRAPG